jgi:hypothetical protein
LKGGGAYHAEPPEKRNALNDAVIAGLKKISKARRRIRTFVLL